MNILEDLYNKHIPLKIYKTLKHYTDFDLLYDFEQEMMLAIALHGQEKLKQLYEANELDNYFARICINQIVNPKSSFNQTYETKIPKAPIEDYENILSE
jgi:hypothetical protein